MKTPCAEHVACPNPTHDHCEKCGGCRACADGNLLARKVREWEAAHPEAMKGEEA